ncbi:MAG: hypothetical protein II779_14030 [Clostridia bacterium]|nr:hypothetical protein [Clostridia bacterium]
MKTNEMLLYALGEADPRYIPDLTPKKAAFPLKRWAAVGGGIAAALLIGFVALRIGGLRAPVGTETPADHTPDMSDWGPEDSWENGPSGEQDLAGGLPKITAELTTGDMGFEGYMAYSVDELENGNPWREIPADTEALPVYENLLYSEHADPVLYETEEELRGAAETAAERLGMTVLSLEVRTMGEIRGTEYTERPTGASAECEGDFGAATVYVSNAGMIRTQFSDPLPFGSEEEKSAAMDILSAYLGYRDAVIAESGDRDIYGVRSRQYRVYEDSSDPVQKLLNYSIAVSRLYETDDGAGLGTVWKYPGIDVLKFLGDYPVIGEDEARAMLLNGEYLTTVPADTLPESGITEDRIDRVELVYRTGPRDKYIEPYFRFLVRLREGFPASAAEGLSNWGAYYVPAVRAEYLAEIPVWDGSFN